MGGAQNENLDANHVSSGVGSRGLYSRIAPRALEGLSGWPPER